MKQPFWRQLQLRWAGWQNRQRLRRLAYQVRAHAPRTEDSPKIVVFNASSRLAGISQNAAFTLLASLGLRLAGYRIIQFACQAGMSHCVLGTNRQNHRLPPPCEPCIAQTKRLTQTFATHWFRFRPDSDLLRKLGELSVEELSEFQLSSPRYEEPIPLGKLVLPSIRWALRCHHLPDNEPTRYLLRQYLLSAYNVALHFETLLDREQPFACLIFNGILYPEATARWVALQKGVRVVTQEVGFQPLSAFFTDGEATAYPIPIPASFELNERQNQRLDAYLERRFQGKFTMAGIRFWPEMQGLDESFLQKAAQFRQIVPVFTNVVYDTSQVHANVAFRHMFHWLDHVLKIIRVHPETLFVIRAHPDEMRPGTAKQARESVRSWIEANAVNKLSNVIFVDSQEYLSSYELIQRSKFLMVYNSSIGLEATLLSVPVLCAGKARYTQYPTVFFAQSIDEFEQLAEAMLTVEKIEFPPEFRRNARRFLYYQLYRASLPFGRYLEPAQRAGFVQLRDFGWEELLPERSPTIQTILRGFQEGGDFLLPEEVEWIAYGED
ncbi:MAG: hypothetical protein NZ840_09370 [Anaerolineales bacterium]|nr:hypothetical protein [Anaerolineales bacterium]MDW8162250.1 hypothetical protein [Anaerolineales bacterium]